MSTKSTKIRNNISLVLMTTLLSGVVVSEVKAIDGGSYAAQQGLKKRLEDAKKAASGSNESPYMFHDTTSDPETEKKEQDELKAQADKEHQEDLKKAKDAQDNSRAQIDDEDKKLKAINDKTAAKKQIEDMKNKEAEDSVEDQHKRKSPSIMQEAEDSDVKSSSKSKKIASKLSNLKDNVKSKSSKIFKNSKEKLSDIHQNAREKLQDTKDYINDKRYDAANDFKTLKAKGHSKLLDIQEGRTGRQTVDEKALTSKKVNLDANANTKNVSQKAQSEAKNAAAAEKVASTAEKSETSAPKRSLTSKIKDMFGGSKPKPAVPTNAEQTVTKSSGIGEEASTVLQELEHL